MKNQFLLDVRTPEEFQESHIPGSKLIPMNEIPDNIEEIKDIKQEILIICRSGARAEAVQGFLIRNNITNTKVLEGGILEHGTGPIN
jgi:rhodanese-related sulfurtransferase